MKLNRSDVFDKISLFVLDLAGTEKASQSSINDQLTVTNFRRPLLTGSADDFILD